MKKTRKIKKEEVAYIRERIAETLSENLASNTVITLSPVLSYNHNLSDIYLYSTEYIALSRNKLTLTFPISRSSAAEQAGEARLA